VSVERVRQRLAGAVSGEVRVAEPMSRHTTYRIGGPADLFAVAETVGDLSRTAEILAEERVP
jgi:UDP-N-acetylmuramate dehydrogenase